MTRVFSSLLSFADDLESLAVAIEGDVLEDTKRTVREVFPALVEATPVKTGEARGGWQISLGAPLENNPERLAPGAVETIPIELAKIESMTLEDVVFITNNVPYIVRLDQDGYSPQAPDGIVDATLEDLDIELEE